MPDRVELPLSGPTFERALTLARQGVTDAVLGGPGVLPGLEPILTEATNDRALGALLSFLLIGMASQAALSAADAQLGELAGGDALAERAVAIVDEVAEAFRSISGNQT